MKIDTNPEKIEEVLTRGVEEVIDKDHLERRLKSGDKLRIKFGVDPTSADLHLGHSVPLRKLRQFQDLGHQIILLIGDFTARIGDPTGRATARLPLSPAQISENMKSYKEQAAKILDISKVEVYYNSEWWDKMSIKEMMELSMRVTYSQVSQRADFQKRLAEDKDFTMEEFMYPVLQGYDSVALKADLEIGGNDQKFNMLMGRRLQKKYQQRQQDVMTLKLLIGTDGIKKMSKSLDNFINISDSPKEKYGKIMSIPDSIIPHYFELLAFSPLGKIEKLGPREAKGEIARQVISAYHGKRASLEAEREFNKVFKEGGLPAEIPVIKIKEGRLSVLGLLVSAKMASSKSEAKRLILQGGVKIDKIIISDWQAVIQIKKGLLVQVGKRKFSRIIC